VERRLRKCSGVHPDEFMVQARFRRAARHSAYAATSSPASTRARVVSQPHRKSPTTTQKIAAGTQAQWIRRRLPRWGRTPLIVPGGMAIGWPRRSGRHSDEWSRSTGDAVIALVGLDARYASTSITSVSGTTPS
jgi:hypothetical protein